MWPSVRNVVLVGAVCFLLGVLSVEPKDAQTRTVRVVTDRSVEHLAQALRRAHPPVAEARHVLHEVHTGQITVVPTQRQQSATTQPPVVVTTLPVVTTTTQPPTTDPREAPGHVFHGQSTPSTTVGP